MLLSLQSAVPYAPLEPHAGTVAAAELTSQAEMLTRLGYDGAAVLRAAGVAAAQLDDRNARVSLDREHVFWAEAERASSDAGIGLRIGLEYALQQRFTLIDYLAFYGPTIRQSLALGQQVLALGDDRAHTELCVVDGLAHLEIWRDGPLRPHGRTDAMMATMHATARAHVPGYQLRALSFRFARPEPRVPYERFFGVNPRFGAPRHAFVFDANLLDQPLATANSGLHALLWEHAQQLLARMPSEEPLLQAARSTIVRELAHGTPVPATTARALGMSDRTLRRKLASLGTSHQQLVDELRRSLAAAELRHTDATVESLAERLGFSNRSAFQRAFRRYTGLSPAQYRARFGRRLSG